MNLSVESRVKAHISTPYIDADGRGTQNVFASDYADCMKSPAEFARIQRGGGEDEVLLRELEYRHAQVVRKTQEFRDAVTQREAARLRAKAADAAALASSIDGQRAVQREDDRQRESAALDEAYHNRLESDDAMEKYERLLHESAESQLHRREVDVAERHKKLELIAKRTKDQQRQVIDDQKRRDDHLHDIEQRMVQAALDSQRRCETEREETERKAAVARSIADRMRQEKLQRDIDEVRRSAELEQETAAAAHRRKVADEQQALQAVTFHVKAQLDLSSRQAESSTAESYERLRLLQIQHEEAAQLIKLELQKHCGRGSFLEVLMATARDKSESDGSIFHGLDLLCNATLKPSATTPSIMPVAEGARAPKSVGTMTDAAAPRTPPATRKR